MSERATRFGLYLSDLNRRKTESHGIINYAVGLANALARAIDSPEYLYIYASPAIADELDPHASDRVTIRVTPSPTTVQRLLSDHLLGVRRAARDHVAVLHFPKGFVPILPVGRTKLIATVHDDIPVRYAQGDFGLEHASLKSRYFGFLLRQTVRRAPALLTVSDTSRGQIMDLAKADDLPMPPTFVTYKGITLPLYDPIPVEKKRPVLLHIGSPKPHKGSYEAVQFMLEYAQNADLQLTIVGPLSRRTELLLQRRSGNRIKRVLSGPELAGMIGESRALIFNSEREGFGLPPVEAYGLGTPAVFARTSIMLEILGDTPGGYALHDYADFARTLDHALAMDSENLLGLRSRILQQHDWDA